MAPASKNHCAYALNISVVTLKRYYSAAARQLAQIESNKSSDPDSAEIVEDFIKLDEHKDRLERAINWLISTFRELGSRSTPGRDEDSDTGSDAAADDFTASKMTVILDKPKYEYPKGRWPGDPNVLTSSARTTFWKQNVVFVKTQLVKHQKRKSRIQAKARKTREKRTHEGSDQEDNAKGTKRHQVMAELPLLPTINDIDTYCVIFQFPETGKGVSLMHFKRHHLRAPKQLVEYLVNTDCLQAQRFLQTLDRNASESVILRGCIKQAGMLAMKRAQLLKMDIEFDEETEVQDVVTVHSNIVVSADLRKFISNVLNAKDYSNDTSIPLLFDVTKPIEGNKLIPVDMNEPLETITWEDVPTKGNIRGSKFVQKITEKYEKHWAKDEGQGWLYANIDGEIDMDDDEAETDPVSFFNDRLNDYFAHSEINDAVARLAAVKLKTLPADPSNLMFRVPGLPETSRYMEHQVRGIWWGMNCLLNKSSCPAIMIADDMGVGKTMTAIGIMVKLRSMRQFFRKPTPTTSSTLPIPTISEPDPDSFNMTVPSTSGTMLDTSSAHADSSVPDPVLSTVVSDPPFDPTSDVETDDISKLPAHFPESRRDLMWLPVLVVVPAHLLNDWIANLTTHCGLMVINMNEMKADNWKAFVKSEFAQRESHRMVRSHNDCVYVISYETFAQRHTKPDAWPGFHTLQWGIGIFDESHCAKSPKSMIVQAFMDELQVGMRIALTGTPIHHELQDWVTQADWLFAGSVGQAGSVHWLEKHGPEALKDICDEMKRLTEKGNLVSKDIWDDLIKCVSPWFLRRWADTLNSIGQHCVQYPPLVIHHYKLKVEPEWQQEFDIALVKAIKYAAPEKESHSNAFSHWVTRLTSFDLNFIYWYRDASLSHGSFMTIPPLRKDFDAVSVGSGETDSITCRGPYFVWFSNFINNVVLKPVGTTSTRVLPVLPPSPSSSRFPVQALSSTSSSPAGIRPRPESATTKAVIFFPQPGQALLATWWMKNNWGNDKLAVFTIEAAMQASSRLDQAKAFEKSNLPSVLLTTAALGGKGMNFQFANHVVLTQKMWNLNDNRQAIGRICRIGQTREPHAWILHLDCSTDTRAVELHSKRVLNEFGADCDQLSTIDWPLAYNMRKARQTFDEIRDFSPDKKRSELNRLRIEMTDGGSDIFTDFDHTLNFTIDQRPDETDEAIVGGQDQVGEVREIAQSVSEEGPLVRKSTRMKKIPGKYRF